MSTDRTGQRRAPSGPVPINVAVLQWAFESSGMDLAELAKRTKVDESLVRQWLDGVALPQRREFTALVRALARPSSLFFLKAPPRNSDFSVQFRTAAGAGERDLDRDEILAIRRFQRLQDLISWVLEDESEHNEVLQSLPRDSLEASEADMADQLRDWLQISVNEQREWKDPSVAFRKWREALERNGVLTMQHRFGPGGIRGFSIADRWAPLTMTNRSELPEARCFTLIHELAHLASRSDSACQLLSTYGSNAAARERRCDCISSQVLMPRYAVEREVRRLSPLGSKQPIALVRQVAHVFKVSLRAATVSLVELGHVPYGTYDMFFGQSSLGDYPERESDSTQMSGEATAEKRTREFGALSIGTILRAQRSGRIGLHDVFDYLELNEVSYQELTEKIGHGTSS